MLGNRCLYRKYCLLFIRLIDALSMDRIPIPKDRLNVFYRYSEILNTDLEKLVLSPVSNSFVE